MTRRPAHRPCRRAGTERAPRAALRGTAIALGLGVAIAVAGCTAMTPAPDQPAPSQTTASASPTATPTAPALVRGGTAQENLPFFRQIVEGVWAGPEQVTGRAYIDALVAAGFDKTAMQLTPDTSAVGNPAESIEFSVLSGEACLIGQVGPAIGTAVTIVAPALADGGCLLGATRPIDW